METAASPALSQAAKRKKPGEEARIHMFVYIYSYTHTYNVYIYIYT